MPNSIPLDPQTLLLISLRPLALVDRLILVNAVANSVFPVLIAHTTANLFVYPVGKYLPPGKRFFDEAILFLYRFFKWLVNVLPIPGSCLLITVVLDPFTYVYSFFQSFALVLLRWVRDPGSL